MVIYLERELITIWLLVFTKDGHKIILISLTLQKLKIYTYENDSARIYFSCNYVTI